MKLGPGENETQLSTPQAVLDDFEVLDANLGLSIGMVGVKMGKAMIRKNIAIVIPKKRLIVGIRL